MMVTISIGIFYLLLKPKPKNGIYVGLQKWGSFGKIKYFFGIIKAFQGIGIMISLDNPFAEKKYFLFEIKLLWFKLYFTYNFK